MTYRARDHPLSRICPVAVTRDPRPRGLFLALFFQVYVDVGWPSDPFARTWCDWLLRWHQQVHIDRCPLPTRRPCRTDRSRVFDHHIISPWISLNLNPRRVVRLLRKCVSATKVFVPLFLSGELYNVHSLVCCVCSGCVHVSASVFASLASIRRPKGDKCNCGYGWRALGDSEAACMSDEVERTLALPSNLMQAMCARPQRHAIVMFALI